VSDRLDCLVIGYNDMPFAEHTRRVLAGGQAGAERRIYLRDHLRLDGTPMPYMDALNHLVNRRDGTDHLYHVAEVPNLAAVYLSSFLLERGHTARFVSLFGPERARIGEILAEERPRVVAITTTFYLAGWPVAEIARYVRERSDAILVVGGPLVVNLADELAGEALHDVFDYMGADVYVRESQGESTLESLVRAVRDGTNLSEVPNLYRRVGGRFTFTFARPENNRLDECVINWDRFTSDELGSVVQTRTARSCAYKCSFCDYPTRAGALSVASVPAVERELRQLAASGVRHLIFIDDTFNVPGPRFKDLCRMMIGNDFGFSWYSYFRCSAARDTQTYDLLAESGCRGVFLGIESGDQRVLDNMAKVATLDKYRRGIDELGSRGVATFAAFISGFPGETEDSVTNTIRFINESTPTFFRVEPWWYNHRSPIHQQADRFAISGRGYDWTHATMDIGQACDAMDRIFAEVRGSHWMPLYNFDFWALPYLLAKGFDLDDITEFHRIGQQLMAHNDAPRWDAAAVATTDQLVGDLRALMDTVRPAPAKYHLSQAVRVGMSAG
jgi:p-methyltransferase